MPKRTRGGNKEKARKQRKLDLQREQIRREGYHPGKPRITHEKIGKHIVGANHVRHLLYEKCIARWTLNNNKLDWDLIFLANNIQEKLDFPDNISECSTVILEPERLKELNYIYSDLLDINTKCIEIEETNKEGILEVTLL